jgi:hypothetical protein
LKRTCDVVRRRGGHSIERSGSCPAFGFRDDSIRLCKFLRYLFAFHFFPVVAFGKSGAKDFALLQQLTSCGKELRVIVENLRREVFAHVTNPVTVLGDRMLAAEETEGR